MYTIAFLHCADLSNESFTAGRGDNNDLILTLNDLPEKILCRISKVHFVIRRANCDLSNPVYIEVGIVYWHIYQNMTRLNYWLFLLGPFAQWNVCEQ